MNYINQSAPVQSISAQNAVQPPPKPNWDLINQKIKITHIDFENEIIEGTTTFSINIKMNEKNVKIPVYGKQMQIKDIEVKENPYCISISSAIEKNTPSAQSKALKNALPFPNSLEELFQTLGTFESSSQFTDEDLLYVVEISNGNSLAESIKVEMESFGRGFEENWDITFASLLNFELEIGFKIIKPIAGFRFLKYKRHLSADSFENYLFTESFNGSGKLISPCLNFSSKILTLKICLPEGWFGLCSGRFLKEVKYESENFRKFVYDINMNIQLDFLGILCGKFKHVRVPSIQNMFIFYSSSLSSSPHSDRISSTVEIIRDARLFMENYTQPDIDSNYSLVFLPGLPLVKENSNTMSFFNFGILPESNLCDKFQLEDFHKKKREIFRTMNQSVLREIFTIEDHRKDNWILTGLNGFLSDQFRTINESEYKIYLEKRFELLNHLVEKGEELLPLSCELFSSLGERLYDEVATLKARMVFHMLSSLTNSKKILAKTLIQLQNTEKKISTELLANSIRQVFGIKKINYFVTQFIKRTGSPMLLVNYSYSRKENKIILNISQKALQMEYFREHTSMRQQVEEAFNMVSSTLKEFYEERKILVPEILRSSRYFSGKLHVIVSETNQINDKEESHSINIEKKQDNKSVINCRAKIRKTVQKKFGGDDDNEMNNNTIKDYGTTVSGLYNETTAPSLKKFPPPGLNITNRNPMIWIKLDPDNEFQHKIILKQEENILRLQLAKETEANLIYRVLQGFHAYPTELTAETLAHHLEARDGHTIFLRVEIAKKLLELSSASSGWKGLSNLQALLKKILFEADGSMKPNDFSRYNDYYLSKKIIGKIVSVKDEKIGENSYQHSKTIDLLLKIIRESDNSHNDFNDSGYRATLLKALLRSSNPEFVVSILEETLLSLKFVIANWSSCHPVYRIVMQDLPNFLANNHITKEILSKEENKGIETLLGCIRNKLRALKNRWEMSMMGEYFLFKLKEREVYLQLKPLAIFDYALQKIEKSRVSNFFLMEEYLKKFLQYFRNKRSVFALKMLRGLTFPQYTEISEYLWDLIVTGASMISPRVRSLWVNLYKEKYFFFTPLHKRFIKSDITSLFKLDLIWLKEERVKQNPIKDRKTLDLKHLNFNKRKRSTLDKKFNIKDIILSFFKGGIEQITWKTLCKSILNWLMSEKITENIEKNNLNENIEEIKTEAESKIIFKLKSPLSLKHLRKQLTKGQYTSIEEVEENVKEVIANYKRNNFIEGDAFQEYELLVQSLFAEARNILKEKEKDQSTDMLRFKLKRDVEL